MQLSRHFWRIHARVAKRLWSDIPLHLREVIAADTAHETNAFQWFNNKVHEDAMRLYEDPAYYDNLEFSFRVSRFEQPVLA